MLTHLLTLTADQQTGVKAVLEQQREQLKALHNKPPASPDSTAGGDPHEAMQARRSQVQAIFDESDTKIAALLDDSQKKTYAEWVARRNASMQKHRPQQGQGGDGPPPPPPDGGGPPPNGE